MSDGRIESEESDDDGSVKCVFCGSRDACEHLLLYYDATFGCVDGGIVDLGEFEAPVATAFATALREGKRPRWHSYWLVEAFGRLDAEQIEELKTAEEPELPEGLPGDFIFELLEDAGGIEPFGDFQSECGGRCVSAMRVCYAERPEEVATKAKALLASRLEKDLHPKAKRRRGPSRKKKGSS